MRVIIAGSRGITDYEILKQCVKDAALRIDTILSGQCKNSPDILGERYAEEHGIPLKYYPAEWKPGRKDGGIKRNIVMAGNADALIALWDGKSPGTKHMIDIARARKLIVFVFMVDENGQTKEISSPAITTT